MSIAPRPIPGIPEETVQAARKVYNLQHIYLRIGDQLECILAGVNLSLLDPSSSLHLHTVFRLALVTAFQYAEMLPDTLASEATLKRMDWKYALCLPVKYPGIAASALCHFRQNLYAAPKGQVELSRLVEDLGKLGLYPRTAGNGLSTVEILSLVCRITRLYCLNQAMKNALSALVSTDPDWLRASALPHWYERFKTGRDQPSFNPDPARMQEEGDSLGADIYRLLTILNRQPLPEWSCLAEVHSLAHLYKEQYVQTSDGIHWRLACCANCACHHRGEFE